jgi:hypothetical protein
MNSLSWMIYLADVAGSAGGAIGFIGAVLVFGSAILTIFRMVAATCKDEDAQAFHKTSRGVIRFVVPAAILSCLLSWAIPDKDTIYAIAASEMGEEIIKSNTATKAQQALNAWLDKQIGEVKEEPEK